MIVLIRRWGKIDLPTAESHNSVIKLHLPTSYPEYRIQPPTKHLSEFHFSEP